MRLTAYMVHKPKIEREGLVHFITWMMSVSTHDVVFTSYSGYSCLTFLSEKSAHLPLQVVPLLASWNPVLHSQRKDPGSFTHLWSHPPLVLSHSLMSGEKRENKRTIQPITGPHLATRQEDKKLSLLVINGYLLSSPAFLLMQWMWIFFHHNVLLDQKWTHRYMFHRCCPGWTHSYSCIWMTPVCCCTSAGSWLYHWYTHLYLVERHEGKEGGVRDKEETFTSMYSLQLIMSLQ